MAIGNPVAILFVTHPTHYHAILSLFIRLRIIFRLINLYLLSRPKEFKMKQTFLATLFLMGSSVLFAQKEIAVDLNKTEKYATEVYQDTEYLTQAHLDMYRQMLGQVSIFFIEGTPDFRSVRLSSVNLMDKYNTIQAEPTEDFVPEQFNPLKYELIYYSRKEPVLYYHVDNTNYYIAVKQFKR